MNTFGIHIDNDTEQISSFVVDRNTKKLELHDWQRRGIEYFFNHNRKTIFEVATGSGKTILAIEVLKQIFKESPDSKCLVICPKNVVLEQWQKVLYKNGFDLRDIGIFYGTGKEYAKITITNMQSIKSMAIEIFDSIILDECFVGNTKITLLNNRKETIKNIVDKRIKYKVLSYNIKNKKLEYKYIKNYYKIQKKCNILKITLEDNTILKVTPEQLIFNGTKYIKANKLKISEYVLKNHNI